ncbi:hypothetical protein QBC47DRAFT_190020 [Echria macrotheca]|uniref:Uncharacterized protein n=1 Tax=Echria macrotheca TaxID=438768 RepID=A0AAJ0BBX9_9PEZI|nr:hypothetical protein QBC47DRAFT_190020 [Echria macrotheca]
MHLSIFFLSGLAAALPLNINLGAYSPALVVGDGAIEFGGAEGEAGGEGGGRRPAGNVGVVQPAAAAAPAPAPAAVIAPAQKEAFEGPILNDNSVSLPKPGTKVLDPRLPEDISKKTKRSLQGFDRALQFAEVALTKGPDIQLGTGAEGAGVGIIVDNNAAALERGGGGGGGGRGASSVEVVVGRGAE